MARADAPPPQRAERSAQLRALRAKDAVALHQMTEQDAADALFNKPRTLSEYTNVVDERIRTARALGEFDNLKGTPRRRPLLTQ